MVILGGRHIILENLGQPIDDAFNQLHAAYYGNTALSWDAFETVTLQYFNQNPNAPAAHDAYFNCFTVIWQDLLAAGRHGAAGASVLHSVMNCRQLSVAKTSGSPEGQFTLACCSLCRA